MAAKGNAPLPLRMGTTSSSSALSHLVGREYIVEYRNISTPADGLDGRFQRIRLMRNDSGIALVPKKVFSLKADAGAYGAEAGGLGTTTAQRVFVVDENIPSAGVADGSYFWAVVEGPALCMMPLSVTASIVVGQAIVAMTAATSQATSAGYVTSQLLTGATQPLADQVQNRIGYALSAVTSNGTGNDLLVEVGIWT